jgi:arginyl-tRNA synthetase
MYKTILREDLQKAVEKLGFGKPTDLVLSIPENSGFGDYSSNVALQLSKQESTKSYQSPHQIASEVVKKMNHPSYLENIEVAGPGFINFYLKGTALVELVGEKLDKPKEIKSKILIEYGDPNTHKAFHIGHLMTLTVGESLSRILEYEGNEVYRVNYGSDIGPTVAKAIWGIKHLDSDYEQVKKGSLKEKVEFLGRAYSFAHSQYEEDEKAKLEIDHLTKLLYQRDETVLLLWEETKNWSLDYFMSLYHRVGTKFDRRVNESEIDQLGKKIVLDNLGKIFKEDQGAIIFEGERYGLHNRVFINSAHNPTYEGKEMGLMDLYQDLFPFDRLIILTDKQQVSYHQVVQKAMELINNTLIGKKHHISHGFVSLTTGKMASRSGNVITAEWLIDQVKEEIKKITAANIAEEDIDKIAIAAIKFYFLKYSISSDIIFDIDKSIALQGDTGTYLLYTYTRTYSLLSKSPASALEKDPSITGLEDEERAVLRQLEYFEMVVASAVIELQPNQLCNYLLNLARAFNAFYERYPIIGSKKEAFRLQLTQKVGDTLKEGLYLLGIETVERM